MTGTTPIPAPRPVPDDRAPHPALARRTLVVVPTYNERDNVGPLVREILAYDGASVMVVDDQSPDGTGEVADALAGEFPDRVQVLHRSGRRGLGRSYVEAFSRARSLDFDVICQMDADFSHDPRYLPELVAATARFDLVVGSRYLGGVSVVNWPLRRLILSTMANNYIRAITRLGPRDCTGGFRAWRREALERISLQGVVSDGYAFMVETLHAAARSGLAVGEVPIIFVERRIGRSKLSWVVLVESILMPWRLLIRRRR